MIFFVFIELVRNSQKKLVAQLTNLIQTGTATGPIIRQLVADCFVALFIVGDTFLLFETINKYVQLHTYIVLEETRGTRPYV